MPDHIAAAVRMRCTQAFRDGPASSSKSTPGWRWYEVGWCVMVISWSLIRGQPLALLLAGGLILYWLIGPGIGVFVGGNLAFFGMDILPEPIMPLLLTEFVFVIPLFLELQTAASDPRIGLIASGLALIPLLLASAVLWDLSMVRGAAILAGGYLIALGALSLDILHYVDTPELQNQQAGDKK